MMRTRLALNFVRELFYAFALLGSSLTWLYIIAINEILEYLSPNQMLLEKHESSRPARTAEFVEHRLTPHSQ
jgi:hypothetical protein